MTLMFLTELNGYLTVEVVDHIIVDTTLNQKLPIGINITFPHLRCDEVSVDTEDSAGDNQVNVHGGLQKHSLDVTGKFIEKDFKAKDGECLSCMEGADDEH